jgi:hypothetical protein
LLIVAAAVAAVLPTTVFAENQGPDISFAASVSYVYDFNDPELDNLPVEPNIRGDFQPISMMKCYTRDTMY